MTTLQPQPDGTVLNDRPMAVLPLNPSSKLDQEPNIFEQSFSGASVSSKPILPPVSAITSPAPLQPESNSTLRTGSLSPSMLPGPSSSDTSATAMPSAAASSSSKKSSANRKKSVKHIEDDEKRKNFLERNRIAALKCRQRKKQWLNNLQAKVEMLTSENEQLQVQVESMRDEIVGLKTLLLAHKDCPVAQAKMMGGAAGAPPPPPPPPPPSAAAAAAGPPPVFNPVTSYSSQPQATAMMPPSGTGVLRF